MGTTITVTSSAGITLSSAGQDPLLVTQGGAVESYQTIAVAGLSGGTLPAGLIWTVTNLGTIQSLYYPTVSTNAPTPAMAISIANAAIIQNGSETDQGALVSAATDGIVIGGYGLVHNFGTVIAGPNRNDGVNHYGVELGSGTIVNGSPTDEHALIDSGGMGVKTGGAHGLVLNYGTMLGTEDFGSPGNLIVNGSSADTNALIVNTGGMYARGSTILNYGTILGSKTFISAPGIFGATLITNSGVIEGYMGIATFDGATIVNAGTIIGDGKTWGSAVYFFGNQSARVIAEPGALFAGGIASQGDATQVMLELAAGTHAGTLDMGSSFSGIANITFDSGAAWTLAGSMAALAAGQKISNFAHGDELLLEGFTATSQSFAAAATLGGYATLMLGNGTSEVTLTISGKFQEIFPGETLVAQAVAGGTAIFLPPGVNEISTAVGHQVEIGGGTYWSPLTITNSGTILPQGTGTTGDPGITSNAVYYLGRFATILNQGTIFGAAGGSTYVVSSGYTGGDGIAFVSTEAFMSNAGRIAGGAGGTMTGTGDTHGRGATGGAGVVVQYPDTLINTGLIQGGTGGKTTGTGTANGGAGILLQGGLVITAGTIAGGAAGTQASGTAAAGDAIDINSGPNTLVVDPGAVFIGNVAVTGVTRAELVLGGTSAATLAGIGTQFTGFSGLDFAAGARWTAEGNEAGLASGQTIAGFVPSDTLILDGFLATSLTFVAGSGIELGDGSGEVTLGVQGGFTTDDFGFNTANGATVIWDETAPCFCAGTRIRTPRGEVAVEDLGIGNLVETAFNGPQRIKWIGRRDYERRFIAGNHLALPVCLKAGAIAEGIPSRDLWVSPDHAICEGGVLIHAWRLINGVSITQAEAVDHVRYFHLEFEDHQVIFAENCPAESFVDAECRARFQNAEAFFALYGAGSGAGRQCLPRLQGGFHLHNIQRRIAARAGVAPLMLPPGRLRGNLDEAGPERLHGWAQDEAAPEEPVMLDVFAGSTHLGRVLANEYRPDLRAAGLGSGCHAFSFPLPQGPVRGLDIRRVPDGAVLCLPDAVRAA